MATLQDKVAIITGAGSGIGREIAKMFALQGAKVIVSDLNEKTGHDTVSQIQITGGTALFVKANTALLEDNENLVHQALENFGALHVAINNAGISGPESPADEYPIEGWNQVIAVNLTGVFYGIRSQIPAMLKSGGGSIVNMSSIVGQVGFVNAVAYTASKHGLVGLTKTTALEYATRNIRVNAIGPGVINTPMVTQYLNPEGLAAITTLHPMGRIGEASEVAELALWLSSDKASFVTGSFYAIDGGYLAR